MEKAKFIILDHHIEKFSKLEKSQTKVSTSEVKTIGMRYALQANVKIIFDSKNEFFT